MEAYEHEFIDKIENDVLSESERREFISDVGTEVYRKEYSYSFHRWYRPIDIVKQIGERFFFIRYNQGLNECQENEYPNDPYEVVKHEYKKTITVTEWKAVKEV